jgi:RES domain-containing protein
MRIYRLAQEPFIRDLSGKGSYLYGGRWTTKGTYAVYAAATRSLAYLEYVVHQYERDFWPTNLEMATIEIDESKLKVITAPHLPDDWHKMTYSYECQRFVTEIFKNNCLGVVIPSVIIPQENNVILNPEYSHFKDEVSIVTTSPVSLDERLKGQ